jgi:hypothetical protein
MLAAQPGICHSRRGSALVNTRSITPDALLTADLQDICNLGMERPIAIEKVSLATICHSIFFSVHP